MLYARTERLDRSMRWGGTKQKAKPYNLANKFKLTKTKKQRQNKLNLDIEDIVERFATTLLILFLSLSELN